MSKLVQITRETERSEQSEIRVLERLRHWRAVFGLPLVGGRANPDNDMIYLLLDAEEAIKGLRLYAQKLERKP